MMKLSELIYPDMNVARSVNIERDRGNVFQIGDYHLTTKTMEILERFADALQGERVSAWSLTGPYGMGKSAFLNYLLSLTGKRSTQSAKVALNKLKKSNPKLHKKISAGMNLVKSKDGFFQIAVTAAYEPVNLTLVRGLKDAIHNYGFDNETDLLTRLSSLETQRTIEYLELLQVFQTIQNLVATPLIVVIDEFGKNLDYMSRHNDRGDLFIVQQLAEMKSCYMWVCLHQAFDEYASGLSSVQRREWSKVHGRFEDISFVESPAQMLNLVQKALKQKLSLEQKQLIENWAGEAQRFIVGSQVDVKKHGLDKELIAAMYPLHPITALALIELCKQFAQNDRTLLSFICSGDRYALSAYLNRTELQPGGGMPSLGLDVLYDYFFNMTTTAFANRAESQRWIEIHDILQDAGTLSHFDQIILKNIGVLNLLSGKIGFKANLETVATVMEISSDSDQNNLNDSINNLVNTGTLLFREYAGEYRLWEGSDFDIYGSIQFEKARLSISSLDTIMQQYLPLLPVIASRHAYRTGTIRRFERRWLDVESLDIRLNPQKGFDGLLIYCFGSTPQPAFVPSECADGRPLVVAYVPAQTTLNELALEVAAARSVMEEAPELNHDSVARKELRFRIKAAEQHFYEVMAALFAAGSEELMWFVNGERLQVSNPRSLSVLLSDSCDDCYYLCPHIGNEMISYENLSTAAAKARRELVEAMVTDASVENLGFTGFGPEVAIYRSLLLAKGLHKRNQDTGLWGFTLDVEDVELQGMWNLLDTTIANAGEKGIGVSDILNRLQEPPFGMRQGPSPIYVCLYLLVRSDEIAVFKEDSYRPYLSSADVSLLVKRPDLYLLKRFVSNHLERQVFDAYRGILKLAGLENPPGLRNATMLGVAGPLIKFIHRLPPYAQKTRQVSLQAQRVRQAVQNSADPIKLLFEDIPSSLGLNLEESIDLPSWVGELPNRLQAVVHELSDAYSNLNFRVQTTMMNVFGVDNLTELYEVQQQRVARLLKICDDSELRPVMQAFARMYSDPSDWARGIAGVIVKKHLDSWTDQDFDPFAARLRDYAERTNQLETLASMNGFLPAEKARLLTLMLPNGHMRRTAISLNGHDPEVQKLVDEILELPPAKSKAVLGALAEKLMEASINE